VCSAFLSATAQDLEREKLWKSGLTHLTPYSKADPALVAKRAEELGFDSYWIGDHTIIAVKSSVQYPGVRHDGCEPVDIAMIANPKVSGISAIPRARL
jgi:hypothetical protein